MLQKKVQSVWTAKSWLLESTVRCSLEQSIDRRTTICVVQLAAPPAIYVRRLRLPLLGKRYWNIMLPVVEFPV
ncbi:unnamed protein product, partial [Brenthis ino]